jgi:hypothetical protein
VRSADAGNNVAASRDTTWAVDVSPALGAEPPPHQQDTLRVYSGSGDAKEFKF